MANTQKYPHGPQVTVPVTMEALTNAIECDSSQCWVEQSIESVLPGMTRVRVDIQTVRFTDPDKGLRYVYMTPYQVQLALLAFDQGDRSELQPFKFKLRKAQVTRAGSSDARRARFKEKSAKSRRVEPNTSVPTKAVLVGGGRGAEHLPRRVGGKRPPQLKMKRLFGVRAFRGSSLKKLLTES